VTAPTTTSTASSGSYAQALAAAAALHAAVSAAPDPGEAIRSLALAVATRRESLAAWAFEVIAQLWRRTNPYDGASVQAFTAQAARALHAAQTDLARVTAAAQSQQMTALGINAGTIIPSDPAEVRGARVDVVDGRAEVIATPTTVEYQPEPATEDADRASDERSDADRDSQQPARRPTQTAYTPSQGEHRGPTPRSTSTSPPTGQRRGVTSTSTSAPAPVGQRRTAGSTSSSPSAGQRRGVTSTTGTTSDGRPVQVTVSDHSTEEVLNRPARTYRYQRTQGATVTEANTAAEERLARIVDDNLMLAQRIAEHEALAQAADLDDKVLGYRRIVHPELAKGGSCGMCLVAANRRYNIGDLKPLHSGCHCTVAAITADFDPKMVNDEDLSRLYGDAQSNYRRALVRTRYQVDEHGELGAVLVPKTAHKTRTERARATSARRKLAAKMHREGSSTAEIAEALGVSDQTVRNDLKASGVSAGRPTPGGMPRKSGVSPPKKVQNDDTDRRFGQTAGGNGGGEPPITGNGPGAGSAGFPPEFPRLPNGSAIPFTPRDVERLDESDFKHFNGTDGTTDGGHIFGLGWNRKTEFPQWVQSLEDLQRIQNAVLSSGSVQVRSGRFGRFEFRGSIIVDGHSMVVQVVLDADAVPITIFPVNGDGVGRNIDGRRRDQPYSLDALLNWAGGNE
jgi:hypothetical protein